MALADRLRGGLSRTREILTMPLEDLVRGRRPLDAAALEIVEEALLAACERDLEATPFALCERPQEAESRWLEWCQDAGLKNT